MKITFGPAVLVTAAFIGPGTITTATKAGAGFGFSLIWAVLLAVLITYILQEMAARLGVVTQQGLPEAIRKSISNPLLRIVSMVLIVAAIGIGNAAYQAGNILGATTGLNSLYYSQLWPLVIAVITGLLLWFGGQQLLQRVFLVLVVVMSFVFVITFFISKPDLTDVWAGFVPSLPDASTLMLLALIGTTVVPYNLFLHASMVSKQSYPSIEQGVAENKQDTAVSVSIGGLITMAILGTAAMTFFASGAVLDTSNIARQLEPSLGQFAPYFFAVGLFAAGVTSAIAAPLAAACAICGTLNKPVEQSNPLYRGVWLAILFVGSGFAYFNVKPLSAILFAQAANGILLPFIAVFLLLAMNNKRLLGSYVNSRVQNVLGALIVLLISALACFKLYQLF